MAETDSDAPEVACDMHTALTKVAQSVNCSKSVLENDVSMHTLPTTVSFANLSRLHEASKEGKKRLPQSDYLATSATDLMFSCNFKSFLNRTHDEEFAQIISKEALKWVKMCRKLGVDPSDFYECIPEPSRGAAPSASST